MKQDRSLPSSASRRRQNRIEDLAVLPVFYKLQGAPVLLAGGSDGACWKAELLAAAGAIVHIFAPKITKDFHKLINSKPNRFVWHKRIWGLDSFAGMKLALAEAETEGEAQAFSCIARSKGVPVNVIDMPAYCDFQFGSIVNRSPAIVSISTDGAAPILGQAIRRRIDAILPHGLKDWAKIAKQIRGSVNQKFKSGAERRKFWEHYSNLSFNAHKSIKPSLDVLECYTQSDHTLDMNGYFKVLEVNLNDIETLTLKDIRDLQSADIITYSNPDVACVLEMARREAVRTSVKSKDEALEIYNLNSNLDHKCIHLVAKE